MKSYALSLRIPMASEDVFRELGHLIIARLALRDIALGTFAVDRMLRDLSRARVGQMWTKLSPLLVHPFRLSKQDLLNLGVLHPFNRMGDAGLNVLVSAIGIGALAKLTVSASLSPRPRSHSELSPCFPCTVGVEPVQQ